MYSRSYYPESNERLSPPNNYDGTAFMDRPESEICIEPSDLSQDENEDIYPIEMPVYVKGKKRSWLKQTLF